MAKGMTEPSSGLSQSPGGSALSMGSPLRFTGARLCRLTLDIFDANGVQRRAMFDPMESLIVGSGKSAGLRLSDPSVAQLHCLFKFDQGELSVLDLGSGRPTQIDGTPIHEPRGLIQGNRITVGDLTLQIVSIEASHRTPPRNVRKPAPVLEVRLFWKNELHAIAQCNSGALCIGTAQTNALRCFGPQSAISARIARMKDGIATVFPPPDAHLAAPGTQAEPTKPVSAAHMAPFELRLGESTCLEWDVFTITAQVIEAPQRFSSKRSRLDPFIPLSLVCLAIMGLFLWRISEASFDEATWADDFFANKQKIERWVVAIQPPSPRLAEKEMETTISELNPHDLDPRPRSTTPRKPGRPGEKGPPSREKVMRAGLLGILEGSGGSGMAGVLSSSGGFGAGIDAALGNLKGASAGVGLSGTTGLGGLGLRGMPGGAGGLGIGGLGTGLGGGGGGGGGSGGGLGRKKSLQRQIVPGKSVLAGSCEREVVGAVIGKNTRQVLACYEAELTHSPDLSGKLAVRFTIEPTGKVSELEITESTLGSPAIEKCVTSRIQRWRFPEPKGGGLCIVNYPWVFQQAGEGG